MTKKAHGAISLAEKVDILFMWGQQNGKATEYQAVSNATGVSVNNLQKIRTGYNDNPGLKTLKNIAGYFDVKLSYFDCGTGDECWKHLRRLKEGQSVGRALALRADDLSPESRKTIRNLIKFLRKQEGLE